MRAMKPAIDHEALCGALRALGMLDSARPLAAVAGDARDEAEVIRAYIARERPHLLSCYDMETLVGLVTALLAEGVNYPAALEQSHSL
jgi:hypothetical protein